MQQPIIQRVHTQHINTLRVSVQPKMSVDVNLAFGAAVAARRGALGMTKGELAEAMGIRGDMVGRLERGERKWTAVYMTMAAAGLATTVGALLGEQQTALDPFDAALVSVRNAVGERAAIALLLDRMEGK